ncbi:TolC family protein [Microbulbifer sp. OS29]|uniref:TolC family protein n=1 Tax=Microbulbifer okhotskensis TaxID=2926617 RepID=A0A9X2J6X4_9GAMM|nr:TolC family protein [Microbulbifer okhotskensis]MCO1335894.1 TolC family protein [Microbulbifer okhotskensis]
MFECALAILLTGGGAWGYASEPVLTLEEAVDLAVTENLRVQVAALEVNEVWDDVEALKTRRYPRLEMKAGIIDNLTRQKYTFDRGVWVQNSPVGPIPPRNIEITSEEGVTKAFSVGATQPITRLYTIELEICEGYVVTEMAEEKVRLVQQDVGYLTKVQYYEIGRILGELQAVDEAILFLSSLNELVGNYVAQQVALEYELLDVRARLAQRKLERQRLVDEMETTKERLNALMGRSVETPFNIQGLPNPHQVTFDVETSLGLAFEQRPDLIESELSIERAEYSYDVKKSEYIPEVDLNIEYIKLYDVSLIPDAEAYVSLEMRWEFFDWGRKRDELASRASKIMEAEKKTGEVRYRIEIEVRDSLRRLRTSQESVGVARQLQVAYREKVRVMMNRYREQSALLTDVLEAEKQLDRANSDYNRAVLSVWGALAEYERSVGEV